MNCVTDLEGRLFGPRAMAKALGCVPLSALIQVVQIPRDNPEAKEKAECLHNSCNQQAHIKADKTVNREFQDA
jgi:hypothetical protein